MYDHCSMLKYQRHLMVALIVKLHASSYMAYRCRLHCQWFVVCPHTFAQVTRAGCYTVDYLEQDTIRKTTDGFQWHCMRQE